jgi:hypothetical protein
MRSGVALVLLALFVGACGTASRTRLSTQDAASSTTLPSPWCVPISRERAIAQAKARGDEVSPGDTATAKLVNGPELRALMSPGLTVYNGEFASTALYWVVLVTGTVTPALGRGSYAWAVYNIDARTGDVGGVEAGPAAKAPGFNALPDHARDCTS